MHFLDEVLFQDVLHINDLPFLGDIPRFFWAFCPHVYFINLFIHMDNTFFFFFPFFLTSFDKRIMQVCEDIMSL